MLCFSPSPIRHVLLILLIPLGLADGKCPGRKENGHQLFFLSCFLLLFKLSWLFSRTLVSDDAGSSNKRSAITRGYPLERVISAGGSFQIMNTSSRVPGDMPLHYLRAGIAGAKIREITDHGPGGAWCKLGSGCSDEAAQRRRDLDGVR